MKRDILTVIKKNTFAAALIVLGVLIFIWTKDYKQVPSGLGPGFFPRIVAGMMIGLSILCMIMPEGKAEKEIEQKTGKSGTFDIVITVVSLIVMVGIMKYVHPLLGILMFLAVYLKVIAKLDIVRTAVITVAGTAVLYLVILTLRIPM